MKNKFILTLSLEQEGRMPDIAEIMDTIELGTFATEEEARACMNLILDAAELEAIDDYEGEEP